MGVNARKGMSKELDKGWTRTKDDKRVGIRAREGTKGTDKRNAKIQRI